ncbi:putative delta-60 repeat protein [Pseudomonas sp. GGS8]|uniref:hypothetical protein n=1 Tax=Pseudomonas sp. GGS8 TaxID=2817892 RepID=UPI0020A18561|nr:hypothetical protein [Pseudomonas sp. GGS8]MCP1443031.1 putative delta-60 repeat protein [Pseudomonas sp. GGS8]
MEVKSSDNGQPRSPGYLDRTFAINGRIEISERGTANSIVSDKDGNLCLISQIDDRFRLSRYLVDGTKDETFEEKTGNFEDGDRSVPTRVLLQEDGKILIIGDSLKAGVLRPAITRFHPHGSEDLVFGRRVITEGPEDATPAQLPYKFVDGCVQKGQKILIAVSYTLHSGRPLSRLFCLQTDGEPDRSFGNGRGFIDIEFHDRNSYACNVQTQSDGSIIVAGSWRDDGEQQRTRTVARYTVQGILDVTFGRSGYADIVVPGEQRETSQIEGLFLNNVVGRIAVQKDDKIIIAGSAKGPDGLSIGLLARLTREGNIDGDFNKGNTLLISRPSNDLSLHSLAIQPDGKIVVVGRGIMANTTMELYERVSETGEIESFWGGHSVGDCTDVTIQPKGRVVISGSYGTSNVGPRYPRVWGRLGA